MEKYQIKINNTTINCDHLGFEYSQQDSEASGRTEDGAMHRDVIGIVNKIHCGFEYLSGSPLQTILKLRKLTEANVSYYDPTDGLVTKKMYVTFDKIDVNLIDGDYVAEPFDIRFIQMDVDSL